MTAQQIGTPLRDAAIDPRPGDAGVPTSAGVPGPDGNPHGPGMVHPGLVDDHPNQRAYKRAAEAAGAIPVSAPHPDPDPTTGAP